MRPLFILCIKLRGLKEENEILSYKIKGYQLKCSGWGKLCGQGNFGIRGQILNDEVRRSRLDEEN